MNRFNLEVMQLVYQAYGLEHGRARIALLEEAQSKADAAGDVHSAFQARVELINAATFGGQPEKALTAFIWCLAQCDRDPKQFSEREMLWVYKWITAELPKFASVPLARIRQTLDDMARRYRAHRMGQYAVHQLRMDCATQMGHREEAGAAFKLWRAGKAGAAADCAACRCDRLVLYHVFAEEYAEALKAAKPILSGKLSCEEIPQLTLGRLLRPYLELGRGEEAAEAQRRGYRLARGRNDSWTTLGEHLEYAVLIGDLRMATGIFERHLAGVLNAFNEGNRLPFMQAAWLMFELMVRRGKRTRKLRLPPEFPLRTPSGEYDPKELLAWFKTEADRLIAAFDRRNENTYYADMAARAVARLEHVPMASRA